jgi:hypothetical protein
MVLSPNELVVEVNEDHPFIQKALKHKPPNRHALVAWVCTEIGREIPLTSPTSLTMDEARRIASNIAKLPNYLAANPDFD